MDLTYRVYAKDDESDERFNFIRTESNFDKEDIYVILLGGQPWIVQSENVRPYPTMSMEECAQAQIDELLARNEELTKENIREG